MMRTFALLIVMIVAATAIAAEPVIVILPFDNVSGAERAPDLVIEVLKKRAGELGWTVYAEDLLPLLEAERVRYFDSLNDAARNKVVEASGASAILTGTIYTYVDGKNPVVAISARLVHADGTIGWANVAGLSSDDDEHLFGFGRREKADTLAGSAVANLLRGFPRGGRESALVAGPSKPLFKAGAIAYRAPDFDPSRPHKICVLPLVNSTRAQDAARIVGEVLALRLAAAEGFEVVEPAQLRAAALEARVGSLQNAGPEELRKLARPLGTALFLSGTVYSYDDVTDRGIVTPRVHVEVSLVDAESGKVLWLAQHERRGEDYSGLFLLGAPSNAIALTDRVVTEMIEAPSLGAKRTNDEIASRNRSPGRSAARGRLVAGRESGGGARPRE